MHMQPISFSESDHVIEQGNMKGVMCMQVPSIAKGMKHTKAITVTGLTKDRLSETCRGSILKKSTRTHEISIESNNKLGPHRPMLAHKL
eukprot:1175837-Heterocapsa_arctica.AAC.1